VLLAAASCTLVLALAGHSRPSAMTAALAKEPTTPTDSPGAVAPPDGPTYTLLQMNLCLSGVAGCYAKVAYPAGVQEAVTRIRDAHPDAVTFNEACHGDVARIARRTGYHLRFSTVLSSGEPLPCIRPGGRGRFGVAVLTKAAIESTDSHDFE
jgi:hypothetical protein